MANLSSRIPMRMSLYARDYLRERATDLMNCRIRVSKPGVAYDPVTRRNTATSGVLKYEGPARIWEVPGGQQIVIGDEEVVVTQSYLSIPYWVMPLPETDDLIVVLESEDQDLQGRSLNIENTVRGGGLRASRRFQISISSSKKDTW